MSTSVRRVAVLSFWDPWEAPHGGTLRTRAFCEAFARLGLEVSCVYPASPTSRQGMFDGVERVPVSGQTVGHQRWPTTLQRLKRALLPMPTAVGARSPALRSALRELGPLDALVVSHLTAVQHAELGTRLWLDQSDLWSGFAAREASARRGVARATASWQRRTIVAREDRAVRTARIVTAAGWRDADVLRDRTGAAVHWLPTALPDAADPGPQRAVGPPAVGYLANFAYHPNVDAYELLLERWLPVLRDRGWRLVVAGLRSDELAPRDDVDVLGPIDDVDDFYRVIDATVAPVRLGGGMKVKVIESLLKGRPVIATDFAVEGFPPEVRALATVVDATDPDVPPAGSLAPLAIPADVRQRFTPAGFEDAVEEILAAID